MAMTKRKLKVEQSSGNVFADLGLPDAEELQTKAKPVVPERRSSSIAPRKISAS